MKEERGRRGKECSIETACKVAMVKREIVAGQTS
jgi:hypothetical protein